MKLPSYQDCVEICSKNESFNERKETVNGLEVSMFNYRLAEHKDFIEPIPGRDLEGYELRGLTFVHTPNGPERFVMLHKFFNVNQVVGYQLSDLLLHAVKRIQDKADGSMIRFVPVNGKILAKTKNSFENEQAKLAQAIHDRSPKLQAFVQESLANKKAAIFELVSPMNTIVLHYPETKLLLLQLRDETTGVYEDIYNNELVNRHQVETTRSFPLNSLEHFIEVAKTLENVEGWVFTLANSQMVKLKTEWYFNLHGLVTEGLVRENTILELILTEKMDDALQKVPEQDVRRSYVSQIHQALIHYLNEELRETMALTKLYQGDRKAYVLAHRNNPRFPQAVRFIDKAGNIEEEMYEALKQLTIKRTSRLMEAKTFVREQLKVQVQNLAERYEDE